MKNMICSNSWTRMLRMLANVANNIIRSIRCHSFYSLVREFGVRYNPAMSGISFGIYHRDTKTQRTQRFFSVILSDSVPLWFSYGKWVLPTSCRFKAVRSEKRGARSFVLLPAYCSQLTAHGAMHRNKNLAKTNLCELVE